MRERGRGDKKWERRFKSSLDQLANLQNTQL